MKKNKKKGFTLVELLAVIVVLAIILVIAVPKILDVIKSSRENSLISSVKLVARNAEQKRLANEVLGEDEDFDCSEVADLSENDYQSCTINFDEEGNATVSITGNGKFSGYTCSGTKNNVTCGENGEEEPLACTRGYEYDNYRIKASLSGDDKDACVDVLESKCLDAGWDADDALNYATLLCKNELIGWYAENYDAPYDAFNDWGMTLSDSINEDINCGVYTYDDIEDYFDTGDIIGCVPNYLAQNWSDSLNNSSLTGTITFYSDGGVTISNKISGLDGIDVSQAHNEGILAYELYNSDSDLYDIYIVSDETIYFPINSNQLFYGYYSVGFNLKSINFNDSIDTSKVKVMSEMFEYCNYIEELDLSSFDMSNVIDMYQMLGECRDLSTIYVSSSWSINEAAYDGGRMFESCLSLVGGNGTTYDSGHQGITYAIIDGEGGPGYLTRKV